MSTNAALSPQIDEAQDGDFQLEKGVFTLRRGTNKESRVFFKFDISKRTYDKVPFADIEEGDRIIYVVKPGNERSGIFIAVGTPYFDRNYGLVCSVQKFSSPPEETVTFQEVRHLCHDSGLIPIFIERNGDLLTVADTYLSPTGAIILKIKE